MSFWLNDNKFIVCLRQISLVNKIAYSILLPLTGVLLWSYFFYFPVTNQIKKTNSLILDCKKQIDNLKSAIELTKREKNLNKKLQLDFNMFSRLTFDSSQISDLLLTTMAKHNISCSAISPIFTKCKQEFEKHYFNVVLKCRYADFIEFCRELKQQSIPLKFCYLKVVRWKDGKIKAEIIFRNICVNGM